MSYEKKLTTFRKGNQLSNCGEYNLQDLQDMFAETKIGGTDEEIYLEDILTESNTWLDKSHFELSMSVTIMEQLNNDEIDMFIVLEDDNEVPCSLELDYEFANESI